MFSLIDFCISDFKFATTTSYALFCSDLEFTSDLALVSFTYVFYTLVTVLLKSS